MPKKTEKDPVVDAKIVGLRQMTAKEMANEGWDEDNSRSNPVVIELSNGTILYASSDPEGNRPGALFGCTKDGNSIAYY